MAKIPNCFTFMRRRTKKAARVFRRCTPIKFSNDLKWWASQSWHNFRHSAPVRLTLQVVSAHVVLGTIRGGRLMDRSLHADATGVILRITRFPFLYILLVGAFAVAASGLVGRTYGLHNLFI